jgi:hypothetical protein
MSEQDEKSKDWHKTEEAAREKLAKQPREEVVRGIGFVCLEFQKLEGLLKSAIGEIISRDDPMLGAIITSELSFDGLMNVLRAIWKDRWEGSVEDLNRILSRCNAAKEKRNMVVHSEWFLNSKDAEGAIRFKDSCRSKKKSGPQPEKFTTDMMKAISDELNRCVWDLAGFLNKHGMFMPRPPAG